MKNRRISVIVLGLAWFWTFSCVFAGRQAESTKSWRFHVEGGAVKMQLAGDNPEAQTLLILHEGEARPSLSQEVQFIREVLKQLPSIGMDPRHVRHIQMRGFAEPDVARGVAIASLSSKEWNSLPRRRPAGTVLKDLLNLTGAYNQLNVLFESYGYRVRVGGVEKVSSVKCSDLNLSGIDCSRYQNPQVPTGGNIFISLDQM